MSLVRLPPKTVANLASKFDNLLQPDDPVLKTDRGNDPEISKVQMPKNDISKIIDTLNKLDDEAKKSTVKVTPKRPTLVRIYLFI